MKVFNTLNMLKKFCSIQTKDFEINGFIFRINKFGVHKLKREESFDTGFGFCYGNWSFLSFGYEQFMKDVNNNNKKFKPIIEYIEQNKQNDFIVESSKLAIKIVNHTYPVIKLYEDSYFIFLLILNRGFQVGYQLKLYNLIHIIRLPFFLFLFWLRILAVCYS